MFKCKIERFFQMTVSLFPILAKGINYCNLEMHMKSGVKITLILKHHAHDLMVCNVVSRRVGEKTAQI